MADYVEGPRYYRITPDNHGAKVLAAAYIMMQVFTWCQTVLAVLARAGIKFSTTRAWCWDDSTIAVATVFALGHTGSMAAAYNYGMGQKMSAGGSKHWQSLEQSFYASSVLYVVAIFLAKISILLFIRRLTPSRNTARACYAFLTFLTLWGTAFVLGMLFACGLPAPWRYELGQCIDLRSFVRVMAIIDIVTDLLLVALPVYLFARVKYSNSSRWTVIVVFSLRALILIPSILRYLAISKAFDRGPAGDVSWNAVPYLTWETVAVHFSVISASIPCVRPFLRSLESGLYDASLKIHPRLARASSDANNNLMLMTLSGWSVRKGMGRNNEDSISTDTTLKRPLRSPEPIRDRTDSPELGRQQSISSEAEFSQKLHPERSWHQTKIQSLRTYPQFGKLNPPSEQGSAKKRSGESDRWDIAVTKETRIKFEREGVILQELSTSLSNQ